MGEKSVVFSYGRMNPPHKGHEKLVNKVKEVAKNTGSDHQIVLSHSNDPKKNPLSQAKKVEYARKAFPGTNISGSSKENPSFLSHLTNLSKQGYKNLHLVVGADRTKEMHHLLHKYNGKEFHFKNIHVHSAGDRDEKAKGTEGMSASKMRFHAHAGNYHEFAKGVPDSMPEKDKKNMYHEVRKGMGVKESVSVMESLSGSTSDYFFGSVGDYSSSGDKPNPPKSFPEVKAQNKSKLKETSLGTGANDRETVVSDPLLLKGMKEDTTVATPTPAQNSPFYNNPDLPKAMPYYATEDVDAMFEAMIMGPAVKKTYQHETPGEVGYVGKSKKVTTKVNHGTGTIKNPPSEFEERNPIGDDPTITSKIPGTKAEEKNPEKTKKTLKRLRDDYPGADYDSRLSGSPRAPGGLGGSYSTVQQEEPKKSLGDVKRSLSQKHKYHHREEEDDEGSGSDGDETPPEEFGYSTQQFGGNVRKGN